MNLATDKQLTFLKKLVDEKDTAGLDEMLDLARQAQAEGVFTTKHASSLIDTLIKLPRKKTVADELDPANRPPVAEGMHKLGDRIFKVQRAVHGSGNLYAKELVQDEDGDKWRFAYAPGAMRLLSGATEMTLDEAKEFGVLYGTCCVCGRTLTNETSIEEGIGPVCSGRFDR